MGVYLAHNMQKIAHNMQTIAHNMQCSGMSVQLSVCADSPFECSSVRSVCKFLCVHLSR